MTAHHLPAYQRVVESIKDDIRSGRLAAGEKLPGNRSLAEVNGVALATLQKALKALHDEGWVTVTPAVGVYVNEPPSEDRSVLDVPALAAELTALRRTVEELTERVDALDRKSGEK